MTDAPAPIVPRPLSRPPVIGFVGIHSNGRPDQPVSQNETLAGFFTESGYRTRKASGVRRPWIRTLHQVAAMLWWRDVDVVVIACFSGRSFWISELSSRLARATSKRAVLFLHGGALPEFGPVHRAWVESVMLRADLVLAPSDFLAETFRDWGIDVRVIPNVLALDNYEYRLRTPLRPRILWMRTFHEHYDPVAAVRCFARVVAEVPDATMTMGGADHGLLSVTRREAEMLGVDDRIDFPGYLDATAKRRAFAEHDVFLNTNLVDNMPVSVLEAGASGLVLVATAVGGIPALVADGADGVLVPAGDDERMAAEVIGLLGDPDRSGRLSAGARALAERSGWPQVRRRWEEELTLLVPDRTWS
jgi:L-malate glycosyltransferase